MFTLYAQTAKILGEDFGRGNKVVIATVAYSTINSSEGAFKFIKLGEHSCPGSGLAGPIWDRFSITKQAK